MNARGIQGRHMAGIALSDRRLWVFAIGGIAVTVGVGLHLPMFWMGRSMGFHMAGMPMNSGMIAGMWMIIAGIGVAAYGLLPRNLAAQRAASEGLVVAAPEDAPLSWAHWRLMLVLVVALV